MAILRWQLKEIATVGESFRQVLIEGKGDLITSVKFAAYQMFQHCSTMHINEPDISRRFIRPCFRDVEYPAAGIGIDISPRVVLIEQVIRIGRSRILNVD
ncbi:MAG: hypothetical protein GF355_03735 [Candidatus Eisenbacteria bacterium]|nr:hypothetical protein [Candidatus Eisenbacteria bacterium]